MWSPHFKIISVERIQLIEQSILLNVPFKNHLEEKVQLPTHIEMKTFYRSCRRLSFFLLLNIIL